MDDKELDKLFREKLYSHSSPVGESDRLWNEIAAAMDKPAGAARMSRLRRRIVYVLSPVAAMIVAVYFLFAPSSTKPYMQEPAGEPLSAAVIEEVPQELPIFQPKIQPSYKPVKKKTILTPLPETAGEAALSAPVYVAEVGDIDTGDSGKADAFVPLSSDFAYFDDNINVSKKRISKYTLAVASNIISGNSLDGAVTQVTRRAAMSYGGEGAGIPAMEQVSDTKYSLPLNLGLQVQVRLNPALSVGAGINYTMLRSKYDCLIDKKMNSASQTLHYIGIPVNVYGTIVQKKGFSVYANIGGTIEKGLRASYSFQSYDNRTEYGTSIEGVQFSVNFGFGVEYKFVKQFGLYLEPNAVYFFNSKVPNSIRTDQPFQLKAEIGFRFHL